MQRLKILSLVLDHKIFFQSPSNLILRNIPVSPCLDGREINLIYGPLHSGKTSFLKYVASLVHGGKVYINFGDSRFEELEPECFQEIEEIATEVYTKTNENEKEPYEAPDAEGAVYYFLDEIHNVPGWESWVDRLNRKGARVFVTSSSANILSQEVTSLFADRNRILKLLPFSFKEYLTLKGLRVPKPNFLTPSRCDEMLCLFLHYFDNGGYPGVIKDRNPTLSRKYFEETLQTGVIARHNIQDAEGLKRLAVFLISNMASEYSLDTLKKVSGIDNEDTIRNYLDYLEEAFLLYRTPMFNHLSENGKEKDVPCKVYAGDTGFFKTVYPNYPDSLGLRFENLVFLELLRQGKQVSYFRDRRECDFLIIETDSQAVKAAIQVSVYFGSPAVREREVLGLMAAMEEYGLNEGLILTMDDEGVMEISGKDGEKKRIIINSVWKWMLE
ncbi:ATP-binding protein [Methanosarcina sp. WH1]|uniref:ATP-binding protein n=1 Tax=Methanosarcina sp. WH1 TaxID=1434102 RepID=UPI00064FCD5F|nr:ATP-binding protein [Methanosarcina sp. WH1]